MDTVAGTDVMESEVGTVVMDTVVGAVVIESVVGTVVMDTVVDTVVIDTVLVMQLSLQNFPQCSTAQTQFSLAWIQNPFPLQNALSDYKVETDWYILDSHV